MPKSDKTSYRINHKLSVPPFAPIGRSGRVNALNLLVTLAAVLASIVFSYSTVIAGTSLAILVISVLFFLIRWVRRGDTKKRRIILLVFVALVIFYDLSPLGGTINFYSTWIKCGNKPVYTQGSGLYNANVPSYHEEPRDIRLFGLDKEWYCTPLEAERAGFSANENYWEYPHLQAAGLDSVE